MLFLAWQSVAKITPRRDDHSRDPSTFLTWMECTAAHAARHAIVVIGLGKTTTIGGASQ
jgi:hypothetical protein